MFFLSGPSHVPDSRSLTWNALLGKRPMLQRVGSVSVDLCKEQSQDSTYGADEDGSTLGPERETNEEFGDIYMDTSRSTWKRRLGGDISVFLLKF